MNMAPTATSPIEVLAVLGKEIKGKTFLRDVQVLRDFLRISLKFRRYEPGDVVDMETFILIAHESGFYTSDSVTEVACSVAAMLEGIQLGVEPTFGMGLNANALLWPDGPNDPELHDRLKQVRDLVFRRTRFSTLAAKSPGYAAPKVLTTSAPVARIAAPLEPLTPTGHPRSANEQVTPDNTAKDSRVGDQCR